MKPLILNRHSRPVSDLKFSYTGEILFSSGREGTVAAWDTEDGSLLAEYSLADNTQIDRAIFSFDIPYIPTHLFIAGSGGVSIFNVETKAKLPTIEMSSVCRFVSLNREPNNQLMLCAVQDEFRATKACIKVFVFEDDSYTNYKEICCFEGYTSKCGGAYFGPYDETIISRHEDGSINVWCLQTGKRLKEQKLHEGQITSLSFNAARTLCLTTSVDCNAALWRFPDFELIQKYPTDRRLNTGAISPLCDVSDDSNRKRYHVMVGGGQRAEEITITGALHGKLEALLLHLVTGDLLGVIGGHFSPINALAFSPDGTSFATGAEEGNVHFYRFDPNYFTDPRLALTGVADSAYLAPVPDSADVAPVPDSADVAPVPDSADVAPVPDSTQIMSVLPDSSQVAIESL